MTEGLSDDELRRLFAAPRVSGTVSMLRPLEIFIPTKWLQELCRDSLARIDAKRDPSAETPEQRQAAARARQQRVDFLARLQQETADEVYVALYPAHEDGLSDDDFLEFLDDLPKPF